jgi:hypothetical protein
VCVFAEVSSSSFYAIIGTVIYSLLHVVTLSKKVKEPRYRPGVAQSVGRGIALLFRDHGTRRG